MTDPIALSLLRSYESWLTAYGEASITLHEQTAAIVLRDGCRLEAVAVAAKVQLARLKALELESTELLHSLALQLATEASIVAIAKKMPKDEGERLHALANQVLVAARGLDALQRKNYNLAREPVRLPIFTLRRPASTRA